MWRIAGVDGGWRHYDNDDLNDHYELSRFTFNAEAAIRRFQWLSGDHCDDGDDNGDDGNEEVDGDDGDGDGEDGNNYAHDTAVHWWGYSWWQWRKPRNDWSDDDGDM